MKPMKSLLIVALMTAFLAGGAFLPHAAEAGEKPRRLSPATRSALVKSQEALNQEQYKKAREILKSYLKDHTEEAPADVYWLLGNTWFLEDKPDQACEAYRKGLARFPENASLHQNYAIASYLNQDFQEAGDYFVKAFELETEKADLSLLFKGGSAYYNAQAYDKAKQTLNRLMAEAETVKPEWRKLLVYTHVSLKDWDAAESAMTPLLEETPENSDFWKLLAKIHLNRNNYKDAATALNVAYEIKSPEATSWGDLADMYFYINAPLKAGKCLAKGHGEDLTPEHYDRLARAYSRALRYDKAVSCINKAIDQEPTADRYKLRAMFYYKDRSFGNALASFEKAIDHAPKDDWAHLMMGFCAMEMDDWELAQSAFSDAAKSNEYGTWAKSALAMVDDLMDAKKAAEENGIGIKISMK
ncbi:MAG: tetratricopeptide repeat protein [Desulfobacterales bacterium]